MYRITKLNYWNSSVWEEILIWMTGTEMELWTIYYKLMQRDLEDQSPGFHVLKSLKHDGSRF